MKAKQYEIWIADQNPTMGTEPGKIRPVIVLQTDLLNKHHSSSIICPVTTNIQKDSEILRVHLKKGCCGLNEGCDIMIDQVRAIDNKRLVKKISLVPNDIISKVKDNLKIIFDLE
ncbi:MAG: type II toxin-antitoxin system PemK/MazF family toxin [Bacteroidales bacterium]|jgi:mRNA interferase MazF|nr:type II toxin-antitoxin system PemK/MazF family toxin [Bacteroidales bacterium]